MSLKSYHRLLHLILLLVALLRKQSNVAPVLLVTFLLHHQIPKKDATQALTLFGAHSQWQMLNPSFFIPAYLSFLFLPFPSAVLWCSGSYKRCIYPLALRHFSTYRFKIRQVQQRNWVNHSLLEADDCIWARCLPWHCSSPMPIFLIWSPLILVCIMLAWVVVL